MPYDVGDCVADFTLTSAEGKLVTLSDVCGVPHVLLFLPREKHFDPSLIKDFTKLHREFEELRTPVFAIQSGTCDRLNAIDSALESDPSEMPFPLLLDSEGQIGSDYVAVRFKAVLIDMNNRVARLYESADFSTQAAAQILSDVKALLHREEPRQMIQQAPVLLIPNVISHEFCRELIQVWETRGNEISGFMKQVGGETVNQHDHNHKIRRDHFVQIGSILHKRISDFIGRRITGEVYKAFNFHCTRQEQIKIACYDSASGGYFRPHRDNTTSATAHRRFACSLLLNDDYEGGYLRFPEYGPHLYRPQAGSAAVFSCSLLHEATDVTAGRRFVLVTFLYSEIEAKMREEYNRHSGGTYRA